MKKIRLFLVAMLMCMVTNGMAQDKNTPDTKRAYYIYSWIQLRWANKANGEPCIVILESSGRGKKQKPSIMKTEERDGNQFLKITIHLATYQFEGKLLKMNQIKQ